MATNSQRAIGIKSIPDSERDLAEQFRIAAEEWADLDAAAFMLSETKTTVLEELKHKYVREKGEMADNKCERLVKATVPGWREFLREMTEARRKANMAKATLDYLRVKERQIDRGSWDQRTERRMGRSST